MASQIETYLDIIKDTKREHLAWSELDDAVLRYLAAHNTPTRVCGLKLRRSEQSIYTRAQHLGITLKPTNQSPYNRLIP